jgi:hypothetical protein
VKQCEKLIACVDSDIRTLQDLHQCKLCHLDLQDALLLCVIHLIYEALCVHFAANGSALRLVAKTRVRASE